MASEEIILYEGLVVLVLVLGFGLWELASLKRANREAREREEAVQARRDSADG